MPPRPGPRRSTAGCRSIRKFSSRRRRSCISSPVPGCARTATGRATSACCRIWRPAGTPISRITRKPAAPRPGRHLALLFRLVALARRDSRAAGRSEDHPVAARSGREGVLAVHASAALRARTLSFWEGLQAEPERRAKHYGALWRYLEGASYVVPTQRYLETFGRDRMQVLWFEDLVRDPSDDAAPDFHVPGCRSGGADRYQRRAKPIGGAALAPLGRPAQQSGPAPPRPPAPATGAGGARGHSGDDR